MTKYDLREYEGAMALPLIEKLADAYMKGYADDPDIGHSIYAREEFIKRTSRQAGTPGFTLVIAHTEGMRWAGFSFGVPFPAGRWWAGDHEIPVPDELIAMDTFAVIELVVLPLARGRGLATRLINRLLGDRTEPLATLLADQSGHARSIYDQWGWRCVGTVRPAPDVPPLDILVKPSATGRPG